MKNKADLALFSFLFLTLASRQHRKLMTDGNAVFVVKYSLLDDSLAEKCEKIVTNESWMLGSAWTKAYTTDVYAACHGLLKEEGMLRLKPETGIPTGWKNFGELNYSLSDICSGDYSDLNTLFTVIDHLHY